MKHTNGPWYIAGNLITASNGCTIASVNTPYQSLDKQQANARLIAAAPDMFRALKALEPYLLDNFKDTKEYPKEYRAYRLAFKAIAKATGEK